MPFKETWRNISQTDRPQVAAQYGAWKTDDINVRSERVKIFVFLQKQSLGEGTSMSSNTYILNEGITVCLRSVTLHNIYTRQHNLLLYSKLYLHYN